MMAAVRWYIAVQVLGALAFVLIAPAGRLFADRGFTLSKSLGVLLCGLILWIGTALGVLRNEAGGAVLAAIALAVASLLLLRRSRTDWRTLLPDARVLVATELLFLVVFAAWCFVRSMDPAVSHTEQPMDLMLLTTISTSPTFPPEDAWLAGYPVGYYYVGYWLMSTVGMLSGVPPAVGYNVGQACWFALLVVGCFGIGLNLASAGSESREVPRAAIAAGVITVLAVTMTSNLHLLVDWMGGGNTSSQLFTGAWWWWPSSRVVHDVNVAGGPIEVITEFPFFSYLLGDNHPHLLSMPFVALTIGLALHVFLAASRSRSADADRITILACLVCAVTIPINTWDFPAAAMLVLLARLLPVWLLPGTAGRLRDTLQSIALLLAAALVVSVPFLFTAQSQIRGVLPNLFHPTPLPQLAVMFGTFVPALVLLFTIGWITGRSRVRTIGSLVVAGLLVAALALAAGGWWATASANGLAWLSHVAAGVDHPIAFAIDRWRSGWPVTVLLVVGIAFALSLLTVRLASSSRDVALSFALLLAIIGLVLVLVPELVYAHDVFENRMNTVFKLYYQAWLFLAVSGSLGVVLAWQRGGRLRVGAAVAVASLASGLIYPPLAVWDRTRGFQSEAQTLDSLDHLRRERPDEFAAIAWINTHARRGSVIAEAAGESYHADQNRVSMATARPALLGWQGHERQWRGAAFDTMAAGRAEALRRIYNPSSDEDLQQALVDWNVSLVFLSGMERAQYSMADDHEARIGRVMALAFEQGGVRIYRRRG